jgi:hypothetical protein
MRIWGAVLLATALLAPGAPAAAAESAGAVASDGPAYYWRWSDGSEARVRTLAEHEYEVPSRLPRLVVQTHPATPGRRIALQARQADGWITEDSGSTDARGAVRLQLNPYCPNGDWCRSTFAYRLLVDGQTATLRVTFTR